MSDVNSDLERFKNSLLTIQSQEDFDRFVLGKIKFFFEIKTLNYLCKNGVILDWTADLHTKLRKAGLQNNISLKKHALLTQMKVSQADDEDYSSLLLYGVRDCCENSFEYLKQQNPSKVVQIFVENPEICRVISLHTYLDLCVKKIGKDNSRLDEKIANQKNVLTWFSSQGFSYEPSFLDFEKRGIGFYNREYEKIPAAHVLELRETLMTLYLKKQVKPTPPQTVKKPQFSRF